MGAGPGEAEGKAGEGRLSHHGCSPRTWNAGLQCRPLRLDFTLCLGGSVKLGRVMGDREE